MVVSISTNTIRTVRSDRLAHAWFVPRWTTASPAPSWPHGSSVGKDLHVDPLGRQDTGRRCGVHGGNGDGQRRERHGGARSVAASDRCSSSVGPHARPLPIGFCDSHRPPKACGVKCAEPCCAARGSKVKASKYLQISGFWIYMRAPLRNRLARSSIPCLPEWGAGRGRCGCPGAGIREPPARSTGATWRRLAWSGRPRR
jgi:hypothetical protein